MAVTAFNSGEGANMADAKEAPDITPEDTSVSEEVDTSTDEAEDPFDSLEDSDISFDDEDDDSSEDDEKEAEVEEDSTEESDTEESEEDVAEEEPAEEAEEPKAEEDTTSSPKKSEESTPKKGEPDPELAREAFKRREAERKLRETEQKQENDNLNRYLDEAKDDEQELAKRQQEVQAHLLSKERSQVLREKVDLGIERAASELGLKKADKAILDKLGRELDKFEASNVVKDRNGNIVEVKGDVYQYIKEEMDFISQFQNVGAREQAKSKAKEKSRTVTTPTRTPKEKTVDDDVSDFDAEFYKEY